MARGARVTVLDNLSTGHRHNLAHLADDLEFVEGDIRDADLLCRLVKGCDVVFHQAAVVSVTLSVQDPSYSCEVNSLGTVRVLDACRRKGVRRVVMASSSAVYGDDPRLPKKEDMSPHPLSPYAVQKLTGEFYAKTFGQLYDLETVCLRYFNVYGPRQDPSSPYSGVISIFMTKATAGQAPTIFGDGQQSRDFVYVRDVVQANWLAATEKTAVGQVFNVGTGSCIRIRELWKMIGQLTNTTVEPCFAPPRAEISVNPYPISAPSAEASVLFQGLICERGFPTPWPGIAPIHPVITLNSRETARLFLLLLAGAGGSGHGPDTMTLCWQNGLPIIS